MSIVMQINPFEYFVDAAGTALDSGYIWIGEPNKYSPSFPVTVYYDEALTIPAAMPLRTSNGYIVRNGTPTFLYVDGNYSILVRDKNQRQIFYVPDFLVIGTGGAVRLSDLAAPTGAGLVGWTRSVLSTTIDDVHKMLDAQPINVWEKADLITVKPDPDDSDTWDWSPAFVSALTTGKSVRTVPGQTYRVADIYFSDGMELIANKSSTFVPTADGVTMFRTVDDISVARNFTVEGVSVKNPTDIPNVVVFDMPQARHNVHIDRIAIDGNLKANGWTGMSIPKLNWNTRISNVEIVNCATGFKIRNAAAVLDMPGCVAYQCGTAFDIRWIVASDVDILNQIHLRTGVCQSNDTGVLLRDTSNVILDGLHFENNTVDIDMDGDNNTRIVFCEFTGNNSGLTSTGIKARNTNGVFVQKPVFNGVRQVGFFDVDTSNTLFNVDMDQHLDAPLLNNSLQSFPGVMSGVRFVPNFTNFRALGGTDIDVNQVIQAWSRTVPDGGVTITASNPQETRELMIVLRGSSSYTSGAVVVLGYTIDTSAGVGIRNKNKVLQFLYRAVLGGWILKSASGWNAE